jgi:membrane protein involved in colicin uptake
VERTFDPDRIASLIRQREADAAPRATPRSDLDAAPSRNPTERPSALINRDPNAGQLSAATEARPWRPASSLDEQALGLSQAQGTQTALSCGDVVRARIEQNWDLPLSGVAADAGSVRIRIELNPDGTLARAPAILEGGRTAGFQAVADAAVRAAIRAQPFPIPPAQFDRCRLMNLTFDPRDMYGG